MYKFARFCRYTEWRPDSAVNNLFITSEGKRISNPHRELDGLCRNFKVKPLKISPTDNRKMVASKIDTSDDVGTIRSCAAMVNHSECTHASNYTFSSTVRKSIKDYRRVTEARKMKTEARTMKTTASLVPYNTDDEHSTQEEKSEIEDEWSADEGSHDQCIMYRGRQKWTAAESDAIEELFKLKERMDVPRKEEILETMKGHIIDRTWKQIQDKCKNLLKKWK